MIENVSKAPLHTLSVPLIAPGVAGAGLNDIEDDDADEVPQALVAVTEIEPPPVP